MSAGADPAGTRRETRGPRSVVLGGTGFLGRHVCAALEAAGHDVLAVGRRPPAAGRPGVRFAAADLVAAGPDGIAALLRAERPEVVVNAAGGVWDVDEEQMVRSNVTLVQHLITALESAAERAAPGVPPRLVHFGSAHEYGPVPYGSLMDERTASEPRTGYGRTKLRGTSLVLEAVRQGRVDGMVLRVSNVVGPGAPSSSLCGATAARLKSASDSGERAAIRVDSAGTHRDFVDVRDVAGAVTAAARSGVRGVVNLGGGAAVSIRAVVETLARISGAPADITVDSRPAGEIRRASGDWQLLDISKARELLGWAPRRGLEDSLAALWHETDRHGHGPARAGLHGPGPCSARHTDDGETGDA
ncbi:NAD(P)-dependent oxidoreductase [Streptomyces roseoverticillatus]|uniref:NAD-dependent epimerase/dehydratase family protein n=1 Tax=Streptomyces roseoverticillatus TaxID=66429 RepID=UPI003402DAAF